LFSVPRYGCLPEVRFVRHVTGYRSVVPEHDIFSDRLAATDRLEVGPEVRLHFIPGDAPVSKTFGNRLAAGLWVVLGVPLADVLLAHGTRKARRVVAGSGVFAALREISDRGFSDFEDAPGAVETIDLRRFRAEIQPQIDGRRSGVVLEDSCMDVRHVSAVIE